MTAREDLRELMTYGVHGEREANEALDAYRAEVLGPLPEMFGGLERLIVTGSRDSGADREDAWVYGVLVGWDCERDHEHDDDCDNGAAMREVAEKHGWALETVARLRRYRAAVRAVTGDPVPDSRFTAVQPDPGSST